MGCAATLTTDSEVILCSLGDAAGDAGALAEFSGDLEQANVNNKSSRQTKVEQVDRIIFSSELL
jgi:hypothetical protein